MNLMKKFFYHDALIMANYYLCNTFITKINIYYSECQLCFTWASQSLIQNFCFKREKSFYFKYDWEPLSYYFLKYSSLVYFLIFYFLIKWGIKLWKTLKRRKIYIQLKYNFRVPFINSTFLSISLSTTKWWTFMLPSNAILISFQDHISFYSSTSDNNFHRKLNLCHLKFPSLSSITS